MKFYENTVRKGILWEGTSDVCLDQLHVWKSPLTGSTSCWKSQHQIKQLKYFAVVILKSCDDLFPTEGGELGGIPEISIIFSLTAALYNLKLFPILQ